MKEEIEAGLTEDRPPKIKGYNLFRDIASDDIKNAVKLGTDYSHVLRTLGCKVNDKNRNKLRKFCEENGISCKHFKMKLSENDYYKKPKYCKECGKIIPYNKKSNEFCCRSCSASYNNKLRKKSSTKRNISEKEKLSNLARQHNRLLKTKYSGLSIREISPGCCTVCGKFECKDEFCEKHNFQQLIGLTKVGLDASKIGTEDIKSEFNRIKDLIYSEYWDSRKSVLEIIEEHKFNISSKTMYNIFEYLEIPRRDHSDCQKISLLSGRRNIMETDKQSFPWKCCYHTTWNGESVFLRSSYELDYAKDLDNSKIVYKVEQIRVEYFDSILNQVRVAVPDFYLPETNEIVEIKSDFTLDIQEMLDKFEAYKNFGYIPKLILEHEEVDLYRIEDVIDNIRLNRIKKNNIKQIK